MTGSTKPTGEDPDSIETRKTDGTVTREQHLARLETLVQHVEDAARASERHARRLGYGSQGAKHIRRSEDAVAIRRVWAESVRWAIEELSNADS